MNLWSPQAQSKHFLLIYLAPADTTGAEDKQKSSVPIVYTDTKEIRGKSLLCVPVNFRDSFSDYFLNFL